MAEDITEMVDWVERLREFLDEEPAVESVVIEPERRKISVAASGELVEARLQQRLQSLIKVLDQSLEGEAELQSDGFSVRRRGTDAVLERSGDREEKKRVWREFDWPDADQTEAHSAEEWKSLALQAAICGGGLVLGWVLGKFGGPTWLSISCYAISLVAGGWDAAKDSWENLREKNLDIHFLMLCVAVGAVSVGAWPEGALLLFLFSSSGAMEHYALHRTHREINSLSKAAPRYANVLLADGSEEQQPVSAIEPGKMVVVKPGEAFPNDGDIVSGTTAADEANLTGEAQPVEKGLGDKVFSGTVNLWGP